jgi:murein DD-endopeptidase MepM/ murein hydrolase activator NlpD
MDDLIDIKRELPAFLFMQNVSDIFCGFGPRQEECMRRLRWLLILVALLASAHYFWLLSQGGQNLLLRLENRGLQKEVLKVRELARELASVRGMARQLTAVLGEEATPQQAMGAQLLRDEQSELRSKSGPPFSLPVEGVLSRGFSRGGWPKSLHHPGIDLATAAGEPVLAAARGTVLFSGSTANWGNLVLLLHDDDYCTWYGHLNTISVAPGAMLARGECLGQVIDQPEGAHLHFAVQHGGHLVDPLTHLWHFR